jgi:hypothetical protein
MIFVVTKWYHNVTWKLGCFRALEWRWLLEEVRHFTAQENGAILEASLSLHSPLFFVHVCSELREEVVSDFLNMKGFLIVDSDLILILESFRFDL